MKAGKNSARQPALRQSRSNRQVSSIALRAPGKPVVVPQLHSRDHDDLVGVADEMGRGVADCVQPGDRKSLYHEFLLQLVRAQRGKQVFCFVDGRVSQFEQLVGRKTVPGLEFRFRACRDRALR